jgi:hypothetical protein
LGPSTSQPDVTYLGVRPKRASVGTGTINDVPVILVTHGRRARSRAANAGRRGADAVNAGYGFAINRTTVKTLHRRRRVDSQHCRIITGITNFETNT